MDIVPGTTDDADAVADLWMSLAEEQTTHGSRVDPESNRASVREAAARHAVTDGLLLARDDEVVGFVMFHAESSSDGQRRGVVENLYVRPGYRDRGIGGELLARAERALADRDAAYVALEAMADNEDARRFYRRHGYDPHRVHFEKSLESDNHSKDRG